jgi:hypothetical protein
MSPICQRIARERFDAYWDARFPTEATLASLLELWTDRGVLRRCWQLPDCPGCGLSGWTDHLDVRQRVICSGCGTRLQLPAQVPLAFDLNPLVRHALRQGLGPVALTGRFLEDLTGNGFLWLPGMKYCWNGKDGDIDFLACCDKRLVFAECKDLADTGTGSLTWDEVFAQFQELTDMAHACRAELVVLAVRAEAFPLNWDDRVNQLVGDRLRVLLLAGHDLERGNLYDESGNMRGVRLTLSQVLRQPPGAVHTEIRRVVYET